LGSRFFFGGGAVAWLKYATVRHNKTDRIQLPEGFYALQLQLHDFIIFVAFSTHNNNDLAFFKSSAEYF
jgi:hypothetical protein